MVLNIQCAQLDILLILKSCTYLFADIPLTLKEACENCNKSKMESLKLCDAK